MQKEELKGGIQGSKDRPGESQTDGLVHGVAKRTNRCALHNQILGAVRELLKASPVERKGKMPIGRG